MPGRVIPFVNLKPMHSQVKTEMLSVFSKVYDSNWFILGNHLESFENNFADYNDVKYTCGVSNGFNALFLALKSLGIKEGDDVIVPSNTFIATAFAVLMTGANVVFAEPDITTYNITGESVVKVLTKRTKAVIPVHLYGQPCQMKDIIEVAMNNKLFIVEDNAQAVGASYRNKNTGTFGDIAGISFYPSKNLGAFGDAGAIITNNKELYEKVKLLRNYGATSKYNHDVLGYNMRLDELQAAFLSVKLKYLDEWTNDRQNIAEIYIQMLNGIGDIELPLIAEDVTHVFHLFVIRTKYRSELQKFLLAHGIETLIHYPKPLNMQHPFASIKNVKLPIAEEIAATCLSLPLWPGMAANQINFVCKKIKSFFNKK